MAENLIGILQDLQRTLPRHDALPSDDLSELQDAVEAVLGYEKTRIHEHQDGSTLPQDLQRLYDALDYFQTVWFLQEAIAWDGMLSVPYNFTGLEIAHTRAVLSKFDPGLSEMIESLCKLAAPLLSAAPDGNWWTANPDGDPYAAVGEDAREKIEQLEEEFDDQLEAMWQRAIAKLGQAQDTA
ncbi:hypothetical protein [Pseudoduganella sp. HUAS MS19]